MIKSNNKTLRFRSSHISMNLNDNIQKSNSFEFIVNKL